MRRVKKTLLTMALLAAGFGVYAYASRPEPELMTYIVTAKPGDTIWSICARIASDKDNMREVMDRAMQDSGITDAGNLQPGREIIVRVRPVVE